jgi:hypothetical protein
MAAANAQEWAEPDDLEWPVRRVIDNVDGQDLLECGHPLMANMTGDHYKVFIYGRRCPICHADSARDIEAEIRAHRQFLEQFAKPPSLLDQ